MDEIMSKIIPKVNTKFGAPQGRLNVGKKPENIRIYDRKVPMDNSGAYDKGGVYWGIYKQLRVSFTKDLTYIRFYRK